MKYFSTLFVLISLFTYSQKREYSFDHILLYEVTFHKQNVTEFKYYLTNSKDNSYLGIMRGVDSSQFELTFKHHDEAYAKVKLLKSDFYKAEFIGIACENVQFSKNPYKYQTKNYDFHVLKDTLINGEEHALYKLEYNKKLKKKIRKGIGTNYYIIDNSTNSHLPILQHPTAYEEWNLNKNLPYGIFIEFIFLNAQNERHSSEKLKSYYKIKKRIVFTGECPKPIILKSHF
ncbi:hypothetical protein [Hanstruepera flava]|uniref:hypothetical protein n=1 Tax=Hanstruepera flava TaxID=2930218 RepID=UPI00202860A2|nr:hypothetical protein [Hanstruepera flava]